MNDSRQKQNILLIMVDQLTPFLTGAYGHSVVKTPSLDRLAQQGVRFDAAYSPCPLCAPARTALFTGRYISETGCYDNAAPFASDEPTICHYLSAAGYDTVASGKLHYIGPDQLHGFNRRLTTDVFPEELSLLPSRDEISIRNHASQYLGKNIQVGNWNSKLSYDEETHFRAIEYLRAKAGEMRTAAKKGETPQPFFLCVSYHHPHEPFFPPQEMWDLYEDEQIDIPEFPENLEQTYSIMDRWLNEHHGTERHNLKDPESLYRLRRAYYALVTYVDRKVGQLMEALAESGLQDDTVVIFVSDHGDMLCEKAMVQKRTFYEWSSRIPFIMRFPDGRGRDTTIEQPTSLIDLLPTILDIAGVEERLPMDGKSVISLIDGSDSEEREVFSEYHSAGVLGTCFMIRKGKYKYVYVRWEEGEDVQLFDLENDPGEWHNLAGKSEYGELERELKSCILAEFDPDAIEEDVRESLTKRKLIKKAVGAAQTTWDYFPYFDARKAALEQYLLDIDI